MLRPCAAVPSRSEAGAHSCEGRRILGLWLKDCNSYVCEWLLPFHGCKTTPSCPKIQNSWFLRLKSSWKYGRGMCRRFPEELSPNFFCGWLSTYRSINKPCLKIIRAFWVFLNHPTSHAALLHKSAKLGHRVACENESKVKFWENQGWIFEKSSSHAVQIFFWRDKVKSLKTWALNLG